MVAVHEKINGVKGCLVWKGMVSTAIERAFYRYKHRLPPIASVYQKWISAINTNINVHSWISMRGTDKRRPLGA